MLTIRQEQKPGLASDCESANSAGFRTLSSPLKELVSSEYMAGRSDAESAIAASLSLEKLMTSFCYFGFIFLFIVRGFFSLSHNQFHQWLKASFGIFVGYDKYPSDSID